MIQYEIKRVLPVLCLIICSLSLISDKDKMENIVLRQSYHACHSCQLRIWKSEAKVYSYTDYHLQIFVNRTLDRSSLAVLQSRQDKRSE